MAPLYVSLKVNPIVLNEAYSICCNMYGLLQLTSLSFQVAFGIALAPCLLGVPIVQSLMSSLSFSSPQATRNTGKSIAGKNIANPTAMLLASCMMLDHLKYVQVLPPPYESQCNAVEGLNKSLRFCCGLWIALGQSFSVSLIYLKNNLMRLF